MLQNSSKQIDLTGLRRTKSGEVAALGLSGGVDSHQAASLLLEAGLKVIPFYLKLFERHNASDQADKAAKSLGLDLKIIDLTHEFKKHIIDYFIAEYQAGRTPSPCVKCNEAIKFGFLLETAKNLGADYLATGHYAGLVFEPHPLIHRPVDAQKDQTYFLSRLSSEQLKHLIFPLAGFLKPETKSRAFNQGFIPPKDSQEICFIEGDYRVFLREHLGDKFDNPGEFIDIQGQVLGRHKGIGNYTIGQRRGLNLPGPYPYYVIKILTGANQVVLGKRDDLFADHLSLTQVVLNMDAWPLEPFKALVQIRSRKSPARAKVIPGAPGYLDIKFENPQESITSGQAAAIYMDDICLGGGWIV